MKGECFEASGPPIERGCFQASGPPNERGFQGWGWFSSSEVSAGFGFCEFVCIWYGVNMDFG